MDKGTLSNVISVLLLALGLILKQALGSSVVADLVFTAGMFAFSGGITNSLAIKMLFDRIPGLVGSGVIPARFEEIRREIKRLIVENFFTPETLREFLANNAKDFDWSRFLKSPGGRPPLGAFIEAQWERFTSEEVVAPLIQKQVEKLLSSPAGGFLSLVGTKTIHDIVSRFVHSFLGSAKEKVLEAGKGLKLDAASLGVELDHEELVREVRAQVNRLLDGRLEKLTAGQVKRMMEDVMRKHLGWLVVWGNVLGGLIGVGAYLLG
jgi:uncharacterized membrane protein YheB (UPF0754 family)